MIPQKLQLKNFLSYGSEVQEIDFTPYHLICLSGNNGHGKSALLDAMTWAVWGQARKTAGNAKADQGLLRLGQKQMMVLFDFKFNGYTYRIKREFMLTFGKPYTALEFGMLDESGELISLTEKSIRLTQAKIEQLLGLDYAAFVNSAFLRQGSSNEFSKKSAKERKEILASILGLDTYEELRKKAMEKARDANADKDGLLKVIERLTTALEREESLASDQKECLQKIADTAEELKKIDHTHSSLVKKQQEVTQAELALKSLDVHHGQLGKQLASVLERFNQVRTEWKETHNVLCREQSGDTTQQLAQAKQQVETLAKARDEFMKLKEELLKAQATAQERKTLVIAEWQKALNSAQRDCDQVGLKETHCTQSMQHVVAQQTQSEQLEKARVAELRTLSEQIESTNKRLQPLEREQNRFEKRRDAYQQFVAQANATSTELKGLETKRVLSQDEQNPSCPLCEQNLSASRKKFLKKKFSDSERFHVHRFARLKGIIDRLKPELVDKHKELQQLRDEQNKLSAAIAQQQELQKQLLTVQNELIELRKQHEEYAKQQRVLTELKSKQEALVKTLNSTDPLAEDEQMQRYLTATQDLEKRLATVDYNADTHQKAIELLKDLEQRAHVSTNRESSVQLQQNRFAELSRFRYEIKELRVQQSELTTRKERMSSITAEAQSVTTSLKSVESQREQQLKSKEELLQRKGRLENEAQVLAGHRKERAGYEKQIAQCEHRVEEYRLIAQALSKDGIQALLIEDAIPEIEQEANELLSRLTNNQAQVFIESLRDLKKGGTKETLDINIADSIGIRPYEMFSGGEAFRIDFALRIAISKLLARRAGTSLQTLIIDEGFGSQDEEGLGHIMESLYAVQDDFAKIIIVSHLSTMKEQFPVHFVVNKGSTGSSVSVLEQG